MTIFKQSTVETDNELVNRARRATIFALGLGIIALISSIIIFIYPLPQPAFNFAPLAGVTAALVCFLAAYLANRRRVTAALALIGLVAILLNIFLILNVATIGLPLTLATTMILLVLASLTLESKYVGSSVVLILLGGSLLVLLELYWPTPRPAPAGNSLLIAFVSTLIIIIIGISIIAGQFSNYSLRTKLIGAAIALVLITVTLTTVVVNNFTQRMITDQLNAQFQTVGQSEAAAISELLSRQLGVVAALSLDSGLNRQIQANNAQYSGTDAEIMAEIAALDEQWEANADTAFTASLIDNETGDIFRNFRQSFPNNIEVLATDRFGALVGTSDPSAGYYYGDSAWWQAAANNGEGGHFISEPAIDENSGNFTIKMALPIYDEAEGEVIGVIRNTYELEQLIDLLAANFTLGDTAFITVLFGDRTFYIVDDEVHMEPVALAEADLEKLMLAPGSNLIANYDNVNSLINLTPITSGGQEPAIDTLHWSVLVHQNEADAFTALETQRRISIVLGLVAALIGTALAAYFGKLITDPINRLTQTAVLISAGDIDRRAPVETRDEIGTLARAFNSMTAQLKGLIGSLEDRVANRTQALVTSAEVSRRLSTILDLDELVIEVVNQIRDSYQYYHVQIYLYDEKQEYLQMAGGTGEAGRIMLAAGHKLRRNQGVVGRAAAKNRAIIIPDVSQDEDWLPNTLLPYTETEVAIPIAIGTLVMGILDVQHDQKNGLDEESSELLQSIATQVAIALQNARQVARTEIALAESDRLVGEAENQAYRLARLNEMAAAFNSALTYNEVYRIIGSQILGIIYGDYAAITMLAPSGDTFDIYNIDAAEGASPFGGSLPLADSGVGFAVTENRVIILPNEQPLSNFVDTLILQSEGYQSLIMAPVHVRNEIIGTVIIGSEKLDAYSEADIGYMRQISTLLSSTMESLRLGQRERLLASIVENHPDFIGVGSLAGQALYINPSGLNIMGLPADADLAQINAGNLYKPADAALLLDDGLPTAMESGGWSAEVDLIVSSGESIPVEETIGIIHDANNEPESFSFTMRDIRQRREAEEAIRSSEQLALDFQAKLTLLHEISNELSQLDDLDNIYHRAISLGKEKLGFDRLGLCLINDDETMMSGTYGTDPAGQVCTESYLTHSLAGNPWMQPVLANRERRHVRTDVDLYFQDEVVGRGWHIISLLQHEEKPIGILTADNLVNQQALQPYEPELISLYGSSLSNIIINKQAEQALTKQARDLQAVADVSRIATTLLDTTEMMQRVADLTKERFNLYHVHIYLMSQDKKNLVLTAGAGEVGQIMVGEGRTIPISKRQSLVARAARSFKGVIANNVQEEPGFLPHPLLPETRSELVTPLVAGDTLLGVLDIQADKPDFFEESDITIQTTLAAQIAIVLQNANQYRRTQDALDELTRMQQMLIREGWDSFLTTREQTVLGFVYDQQSREARPSANQEELPGKPHNGHHAKPLTVNPDEDSDVRTPLYVRGTKIGTLGVRDPSGQSVPNDKQRLLTSISQQVAEALERARLFEVTEIARGQTEKALSETQQRTEELALVNEVVTQLGASLDIEEAMHIVVRGLVKGTPADQARVALINAETQTLTIVAEEYDAALSDTALGLTIPLEGNDLTRQVMESREAIIIQNAQSHPLTQPIREMLQAQGIQAMVVLPMVIGNEVIGTVGLDKLQEGAVMTGDEVRLAETIIFQAAAAIQNTRLFAQTESALKEVQSLFEVSTQLNEAATFDAVLAAASAPALAAGAKNCLFYRFTLNEDAIPERAEIVATAGKKSKLAADKEFNIADSPFARRWLSGEDNVLLIEDVDKDDKLQPALKERLIEAGSRAIAFMTLTAGSRPIGEISIHWPRPYPFKAADERLYSSIAAQAASVTESILLLDEVQARASVIEQQARRLATLNDVSAELDKAAALHSVFEITVQRTAELFAADRVSLLLLQEGKETMQVMAFHGSEMQAPTGTVVELADTPMALAMSRGQIVSGTTDGDISSVRVAPLVIGGRSIGTLNVGNNQEDYFSERDENLLQQLATILSSVIENKRLLAATQARAQRQQTLREIAAKVRGSADVDTIMRTAVAEIGQALGRNTFVYLGPDENGNAEEDA